MGSLLSIPRHDLSLIGSNVNPSTDKPPPEEPVSPLATLPLEVLLQVTSFLPAESRVCLSLTSKYYYAALSIRFDMTFTNLLEEKKRFLRLLEEDVPGLMTCRTCNILYRWSRPKELWRREYQCQHHYKNVEHWVCAVPYCHRHGPSYMHRQVVDAYLRGYHKGPAYGPPLSELVHKCNASISGLDDQLISRAVKPRIARGKLILHYAYQVSISLAPLNSVLLGLPSLRDFDLPQWQRRPPLADSDGTLREIDKFNYTGCRHSRCSLPAVILDAIEHFEHKSEDKKRCHGLLNCRHCATDLRVGIMGEEEGCIRIQVDVWHCFGGRNSDENDVMEEEMFKRSPNQPSDPATASSRNLQRLFNADAEEDDYSPHQIVRDGRQSWLQLWEWLYLARTRTLERYRVPEN